VTIGANAEDAESTFDSAGRYIMRAFDIAKPMSSFLPGVGGLWGMPMWSFYVNRGQGLATFGVKDKEGGFLLFQTAEKAYQNTPFLGFRTLLKGSKASGETFEAQPFLPETDDNSKHAVKSPERNMYIGNNEMEVEEMDPDTGIKTNALYFTVNNEDFPALVRRVTYKNEGSEAVDLEVVDGLAKLEPAGTNILQINMMGRTLEGWMVVYNFAEEQTAPFFHLVVAPSDTADVTPIKEGHFAIAFIEDDSSVGADGLHELLPMICDQQLIFGTDTTLTVPRNFFSSKKKPAGASLAEIVASPQSTNSRTPSALTATKLSLKPGESKSIAIVYGHASDLEYFTGTILPKLRKKGYVSAKRAEAKVLGTTLTERVAMESGAPRMDGYAKQNYLDNLLRGGMPLTIGESSVPPSTLPSKPNKIFHVFSRIHGDLERDYNNFVIDQSYWSQGPGNFRDVNQNRRCDVLQLPAVHDFNVRQFLTYVQADGYNQLTVATAFFKIDDPATVKSLAARLAPPGPGQDLLASFLGKPFRPGQLFNNITTAKISLSLPHEEVLELVTANAKQVPPGLYAQNGFWTDHFTYNLDLVNNFLAVFPDQLEAMLYDAEGIPFFFSPGRVVNRTEKNMLVMEGKVRQYDAVLPSKAKADQLQMIFGEKSYVGDWASGGMWQRTASGGTMLVSVMAKLVVLAANKFAIMDPLGMGVEMEAGKPGWNDALNGLPALFGSEMPSAYELREIILFVGATVDKVGRPVELPEEISELLTTVDAQLAKLHAGGCTDFEYWDNVHDALEGYRAAVEATFTGVKVAWSAAKLGKETGIFGRMLARMDAGATRALSYAHDAGKRISPSYFKFTATKYTQVGTSGCIPTACRGLPTVKVQGFAEEPLPLFLEGPTRHLKTLKTAPLSDKLAVYKAVKASELYDTELSMYKVGGSLKGQPLEIGRMMAFSPGWLENESIWLHMSYKWYLELLRAGLYKEFFAEIQKGVVCFMDTDVFGRSPLEAASFIVSSAFPDQQMHGSGFLARLSGTTAEFLSMWNHMMVGEAPFKLDSKGKLQLALEPIIPEWMWRADGTLIFKFLGAIDVTYVMEAKKNSWEASVASYDISGPAGSVHVDGPVVPAATAAAIRSLEYTKMTVTLA
jgi:hypothetical protein